MGGQFGLPPTQDYQFVHRVTGRWSNFFLEMSTPVARVLRPKAICGRQVKELANLPPGAIFLLEFSTPVIINFVYPNRLPVQESSTGHFLLAGPFQIKKLIFVGQHSDNFICVKITKYWKIAQYVQSGSFNKKDFLEL